MGSDNMERIVIYPGNSPDELAEEFAARHGLDYDTMLKLKDLLI